MATQLGTGHIHSTSGGTLACNLSGYISPNIQSLRLQHSADVDRIKGQNGNTTGLILQDDVLECTFELIPEGTTVANAKLSAGMPAAGVAFTVSGLAVFPMGGFADALNASTWIYEGGGQIHGDKAAKWTATLPLKRYTAITSATVIT